MILDGKALAQKMKEELSKKVRDLKDRYGAEPCLAVVLVGEDPASRSYVRSKMKDCREIGIISRDIFLPAETPEEEILTIIRELSEDTAVHGILVQLPLPPGINSRRVIEAVPAEKDVDGFHPLNVGKMILEQPCFLPCTPHGILKLLEEYRIPLAGKEVVVLGRSAIVGRPLANLLSRKAHNATVTLCHTGTLDLKKHTRKADIVIAAAGRHKVLTGDMIKEGAVVVDVGIHRVPAPEKKSGYALEGDADTESVAPKASAVTPVPGGVGPMTRVMLLHNTLQAAALKAASEEAREKKS